MFNMSITTGKDGRHDHVEIDVVAKYINPRLCEFHEYRGIRRPLTTYSLAEFLPHMVDQNNYSFSLAFGEDRKSVV